MKIVRAQRKIKTSNDEVKTVENLKKRDQFELPEPAIDYNKRRQRQPAVAATTTTISIARTLRAPRIVRVTDSKVVRPTVQSISKYFKAPTAEIEIPQSTQAAEIKTRSKAKIVDTNDNNLSTKDNCAVIKAKDDEIKSSTPRKSARAKASVLEPESPPIKRINLVFKPKCKPVKSEEEEEEEDVFEIEISDAEEDEESELDHEASEPESEVDEYEEFFKDVKKRKRPSNFTKRAARNRKVSTSKKRSKKSDSRWDRINETLKAGGTIEALPGRVDEFDWIKRTIVGLLDSSLGGCLYISGVPGTGKTATTHRTLDSLSLSSLRGECQDFDFVEINGMRLSDPGQAYSILAKTIFRNEKKMSHSVALKRLEAHFKAQQRSKSPGRPCIVLLDELDLLLRKKQSILYHFFEWPNWINSQLIVVTIANTMDLPERFLSNRISSRLGLTRYNFKPYDHTALANIIEHQLKDYVKYLGKDAIQLCARKVSAVSGDARRAVNFAKRAVDYFRSTSQEDLMSRITGKTVEKVEQGSEMTSVNLRLMDLILRDALMANPVEVISKLAKHQRILLLSIILARKRLEEEISVRGGTKIVGSASRSYQNLSVNRLLDQHFQLCRTHQYHPLPSLQELNYLLESLEALRLIRCVKFRENGPECGVQLMVHEEDVRKGLGDDAALKKYIRE